MSGRIAQRAASLAAHCALLRLAAATLGGRRFYLLPLLPLGWLALLAGIDIAAGGGFEPADAQNELLGLPLLVLGIFLGLRVIAGEIDGRSLEIAYTVPGGCERLWRAKLAGAAGLLLIAEALLAIPIWFFFTHFPPGALYGALQAALFYLALAMSLATLFRSEITGAMATTAVLGLNGIATGFGANQLRVSPLFNPLAARGADADALLAWTVQNRIGVALATAGILALGFMRANRRERMLGG